MENAINAAIEALATIRNVSEAAIKSALANGDEGTMSEVFLLTCAACAAQ